MSRWAAARRWLAGWRGVPARTEAADRYSRHLAEVVEELRDGLRSRREDDDRRAQHITDSLDGITVNLGVLFAESRGRHQDVESWVDELGDRLPGLHHELRVTLEATLAPERDRVAAELVAAHRHDGPRRPGLSVTTITWNHAGWLREAAASAAATLDALGERAGVHLILDDCSSDETGDVLDELSADPRVVVVRAPVNLNLTRARNVLLAACPTDHAVVLDADNRLLPAGVAAVLDVAERYRSVLTWGQVIASDDAGGNWDAVAYAPAWETVVNGLCFDSMAVVDVAAVEALGGYSTDPRLAGVVDDLELLLRVARRGGLLVHVPVVLGRYRAAPMRHSVGVADPRRALAHVQRLHLYDDPDPGSLPVAAAHPALGVLWAWPGARPALEAVGAQAGPESGSESGAQAGPESGATVATGSTPVPRVLLVAPGGVDNLGDDAITWSVLDRITRDLPEAVVEVLSDRDLPPQRPGRPVEPLVWNGTLSEWWSSVPTEVLVRAAEVVGVEAATLLPEHPRPAGPPLDLGTFDVVAVAGGGNLATPFGDGVMQSRLALAACAADLGVPVVWSGQGLGPLRPEHLDPVRSVLARAAAVSCRDPGSVALLDGVDRVELVGDDAVGVRPRPHPVRTRLGTGRYVVVHVRSAPYVSSDADALAASVDALAERFDAAVVGLVVDGNGAGERRSLEALFERCAAGARSTILDVRGDPEGAVDVLAHAAAVFAHSFHVALWALASGTPAVLVAGNDYYRAKAAGLDAATGLDVATGCDGTVGLPVPWGPQDVLDRLDRVAAHLEATGPLVADGVDTWLGGQLRRVLGPRT